MVLAPPEPYTLNPTTRNYTEKHGVFALSSTEMGVLEPTNPTL